MKKISFLQSLSRYEVLNVFLEELKDAFGECDTVQTEISSQNPSAIELYKGLITFKPELIIAFNFLYTQPDGRLICDYLNVPMLYYLVDSPFYFNPTHSDLAWISCIDRGQLRYLTDRGFAQTLFLPHAIPKLEEIHEEKKRSYDCVMLSSGINYHEVYENLTEKLSNKCRGIIEEGLDRWMKNATMTLDEALEDDIPSHLPRTEILCRLDIYLKGLKRAELLKSLQDYRIDLFGGGDDWRKILGTSCPHVTIHDEIPFSRVLQILSKSKVVLNSCSSIRDGLHERILHGLSCGAAVMTESNPYLLEQFGESAGIIYSAEDIASYLSDETARREAVENGRTKVAESHLWRNRVQAILNLFN